MATVNKDFKVKNGLIVEGTTATVDNYDVLTKKTDDQTYIIGLIGGSSDSANTPNTVVKRDGSGNFAAGTITANLTGNVTGDVTGTVSSLSNHDTDDLSEGTTNKYYTDARVKNVLTGSTQTNIAITEVGGVLHITAENGVADSTTDDLTEGTTNKYFTETRVRDALTGGNGLDFTSGTFSVNTGSGITISADAVAVDRTTVDGWYDASGAATTAYNNAVADAASDATTKANNAESAANSYTDGEIITALSTAQGYANTAEQNANAYTDNAVSGLNWKQAVNVLANSNVALTGSTPLSIDSHTLSDGYRVLLTAQSTNADNGIYDLSIAAGAYTLTRSADADAYSELVGAAVYVMEGTQYGSTSWVQSNHYLSSFASQSWTQFSGQGSVTAGTGITVNGLEVSVNRTTVDAWYDAAGTATSEVGTHAGLTSTHGVTGDIVGTSDSQTLTNKTISGSSNTLSNIPNNALDNDTITVNGYNTALGSSVTLSTDDVNEGINNQYYTNQRVRDVLTNSTQTNISITEVSGQLIVTAENGVADSTTDDLTEGVTNHYFTDGRAKDAAADLLTNATKTNITITGTGAGLTITAENGVADSTTDDLTEGTTNLYFTDARAVSALEAVVPNFTAVEVNSLAKQVAATTGLVATASTVTAYSFAKADYRSAKFLVKTAYGSHTEVAEVLLTLDTSDNIAITEYAIVGTNGSSMTISADVSGADVRLRVTTINNNSTVNVVGTLIA